MFSFHSVQKDITDIDVTLATPTEHDKEMVFETHQNGKSITFPLNNCFFSFTDNENPSVDLDNVIKMNYSYPSLHLLDECM